MKRAWLISGLVGRVVGVGIGLGLGPFLVDKTAGYCSTCKEIAPLVASGSAADTEKATKRIELLRTVDAQAGRTGMHLCPSPWHQ